MKGIVKLGINMEFVRTHDLSFASGVKKAAEIGYEYIEPMVHLGRELLSEAGYFHSVSLFDDPLAIKELCDKYNVKLSALSSHTPHCKPEISVEYLKMAIRWAAEAAILAGTTLLMADMDPTNDTFSKYIDNVARPPEASDPALSLKWLDKLLQHALQQRLSLLVDLGGGDTTLRRLAEQLPDLVEMAEAQGFAIVLFYTAGPQEEDLSPLATMEGLGFRPSATAIVLNEAMVDLGDTPLQAFARVLRHSAFLAAVGRGAVPIWMPRLLPAQQVEIRRLHFRDAAAGETGQGTTPLGPFDRSRVLHWLRAMDANFAGIRTWLP